MSCQPAVPRQRPSFRLTCFHLTSFSETCCVSSQDQIGGRVNARATAEFPVEEEEDRLVGCSRDERLESFALPQISGKAIPMVGADSGTNGRTLPGWIYRLLFLFTRSLSARALLQALCIYDVWNKPW